jgi:hypothetical protein
MAEKIQLDIEITPDGEVRIKTSGLHGNSCLEETESLEKLLGKVKERKKTSDFFVQKGSAKAQSKRK